MFERGMVRGRRARRRGAAALLAAAVVAAAAAPTSTAAAEDAPVEVRLGHAQALEPDAGSRAAFIPVTLSRPSATPTTVWFHTRGVDSGDGATQSVDFRAWGTPAAPRQVTLPAGSVQVTVNVPVLADADSAEAPLEFFEVVVTAVSAGAVVADGVGLGGIVDADQAGGAVAFTATGGAVSEGDQGVRRAQFQLHLSRPAAGPVTLSYATVAESAESPADFAARRGTVTLAAGQTTRTIDVPLTADDVAEPGRRFRLEVTVVGGAPVEDISSFAFLFLLDDDGGPDLTPPVVSGGGLGVEVDAVPAPVDFAILAEDEVEGPVSVTCTPRSGTLFPLGSTPVTCTAVDSAGNVGTGELEVAVHLAAPPG